MKNSARDGHRGIRWFAAEFLVVVSGVLLALALTSGYESWQDRQRETNYLRQLAADLRETERLMDTADTVNVPWDRSLTSLLRTYRGDNIPPRDSVLRWTVDVQFDNPVPVLGTVDALVETGELQLIRDLDLRSALTSYLSRTREYNIPWLLGVENDFVAARTLFRHRVDFIEAELSTERVPPSASPTPLYEVGNSNPYPLDVAVLRRDREAYFLLTRMLVAKRDCSQVRETFRADARALRQRLEEALAR